MKKILLLLVLVMSVSCVERESRQLIGFERTSMLSYKLDSINSWFLQEYNNSTIFSSVCSSSSAQVKEDTEELKRKDDTSVFLADAVGFVSGAILGAETGVVMGSFLMPGVGTVAGGVADALATGIATAAVSSVVAAHGNNKDSTENSVIYWEDDDWIYVNSDVVFDENIIAGNIGWLHNAIITSLGISREEIHIETLLDYSSNYLENNNICEFLDRAQFCANIQEQWPYLNDYRYNSDFYANYYSIFEEYITVFELIEEEYRYDYTESIMVEISESGFAEEDIYMLNGMISTFYYSSLLWNMDAINNICPE